MWIQTACEVPDLSPRFRPDCSSNAATTAVCVLLLTANSVRFRSSHKSISPYNGASATYLASTKKSTVSYQLESSHMMHILTTPHLSISLIPPAVANIDPTAVPAAVDQRANIG
eukprot:scaffold14851_cov104-Skeletonema_dohrnii-CCMP3373.AAC.2